MNTETIKIKEKIESFGFDVTVNYDEKWDVHKVVASFHGNKWATVERHNLQQAMVEAFYVIKKSIFG